LREARSTVVVGASVAVLIVVAPIRVAVVVLVGLAAAVMVSGLVVTEEAMGRPGIVA